MTDVGIRIDRIRCQPCGICTDACPSGALEMIGKTVSVDELLTELSKDLVYYQKSGGGVTLSGGEPTLQCEFAEEILRRLNEMGIATALDTCGLTSTAALERLLPFTDYILYDIKTLDPNMHQQFTGVSNQKILANLIYIHNYLRKQNRINDLWIRTPLIPGATATKKNIQAIGAFLAENLDGTVARWELCAFNNLCRDQYLRLDMEWRYLATPLMTAHELKELEEIARQSFTNPQKVIATGATRLGE